MRKRTKLVLCAGLVSALVFGNAASASAYMAAGTKYCPSGRTMTLGSQTGAGYIYHRHDNINTGATYVKDWPNSAGGWKYSSGGYQNVNWTILTSTGNLITAYSAACYL